MTILPTSPPARRVQRRRGLAPALAALALAVVAATGGHAAPATADPVTRFLERVERGEVTLEHVAPWGYLPSLLKAFGVSTDSQMLVFSKTSLQDPFISPQTPRALYFNDEVAVGYVQGGPVLEVAVQAPGHGVAFYTFGNEKSVAPKMERRDQDCARCHRAASPFASGLLVTSTQTTDDGTPFLTGGSTLYNLTDHRTPFADRWAGWYVTGSHGAQVHQGNLPGLEPAHTRARPTQNLATLAGHIDTTRYLEPTSDLVALMTLEHQATMVDMIASLNAQAGGVGASKVIVGTTVTREAAVEDLVAYMLFVDEAPLTAPVGGSSTFTKTFQARGRTDRKGRSLRDFDLQRRVFRYPMSYVIDSDFFLGMDAGVQAQVYRRLYDILTGKDTTPRFARVAAADRQAVLEILRDTHPNLPGYWRAD